MHGENSVRSEWITAEVMVVGEVDELEVPPRSARLAVILELT